MTSNSTDWTSPDAYVHRASKVPRWRFLVEQLTLQIERSRLAYRRWRTEQSIRRLQSEADHLPNYLRRDIGLPPARIRWPMDVDQYR